MAQILPFRAVRPAKDKARSVSSRAYDLYSAGEMAALLESNPHSYLQILHAGDGGGEKITVTDRLKKVRMAYTDFIRRDILIKDKKPGFYLYELKRDNDIFLGFLGAASTKDYENNIIRRHEDTIARREQLFARFLKEVHFNAEPVLLMYPDHSELSGIMEQESLKEPEFDFITPDSHSHRLWPIFDTATLAKIQALFRQIEVLYIADGHHRTASSLLLAKECKATNNVHSGQEAYNYFMSYLLPESYIKVSPYDRMVRDLNGHTGRAFLRALEADYDIDKMGSAPRKEPGKHEFTMYLKGGFYSLRFKNRESDAGNALEKLDSHILFRTVLRPVLGIEDLRNNKRLRYGVGRGPLDTMKRHVDAGDFAVGFRVAPITISDIKAVADAGEVMPPKSTYIEPKLRSGLAFYEF